MDIHKVTNHSLIYSSDIPLLYLKCVACAIQFSSSNLLVHHIFNEHDFQPQVILNPPPATFPTTSANKRGPKPKEKKPRKKREAPVKDANKQPTKRQKKDKKSEPKFQVALVDADGYSIPKIKIGRFNNEDVFTFNKSNIDKEPKAPKLIPLKNQLEPIQNSTPTTTSVIKTTSSTTNAAPVSNELNGEDGLSTLMSEVYNVLDGDDTSNLNISTSVSKSTDSTTVSSTELTNVMREIQGLYDDEMINTHFASAFEIPQGVKMTPNHVPSGYMNNPMSSLMLNSSTMPSISDFMNSKLDGAANMPNYPTSNKSSKPNIMDGINNLSHNLDSILSKTIPELNPGKLPDSSDSNYASAYHMNSLPNHHNNSAFTNTKSSLSSHSLSNHNPASSAFMMTSSSKLGANNYGSSDSSSFSHNSLATQSNLSNLPNSNSLNLSNSAISSPSMSPNLLANSLSSPHKSNVTASVPHVSPHKSMSPHLNNMHSPIHSHNSPHSTLSNTPPLGSNSMHSPLRSNSISSPSGNSNDGIKKKDPPRLNLIPTEKLIDTSAKVNLTNSNVMPSSGIPPSPGAASPYYSMMDSVTSPYNYYGSHYGGNFMQPNPQFMQSPTHSPYFNHYPPQAHSSSLPPLSQHSSLTQPPRHQPITAPPQSHPISQDTTFKVPSEPPNKQPKIALKKLSSLMQSPSEKKQAAANAKRNMPPISSVYSVQRNPSSTTIAASKINNNLPIRGPNQINQPSNTSKAPTQWPPSDNSISPRPNLSQGVSISPAKTTSTSVESTDPSTSLLKKRGITISSVPKPATRKLTSSVNITPVVKKTSTVPEKIGQVEIVPKLNLNQRPNLQAELVKEAECNLGIPIINLSNKTLLNNLNQMGICNFIPVSQIRGSNQILGMPIISTNQSNTRLEDLGACGVLNLGSVYKLK